MTDALEILDSPSNSVGEGVANRRYQSLIRRIVSQRRLVACVQVFDFAAFTILGMLWLRAPDEGTALFRAITQFIGALLIALVSCCVFQCFRLYRFDILTRPSGFVFRTIAAGLATCAPFLAPVLMRQTTADGAVRHASVVAVISLAAVVLGRIIMAALIETLRDSGVVERRLYVISDDLVAAASLRADLERCGGNRVVGAWHLAGRTGAARQALDGALDFLRNHAVDAVVLRLPLSDPDRLFQVIRVLRCVPRDVLLVPELNCPDDARFISPWAGTGTYECFSNLPLIRISNRPLAGWRWVLKDIQDRTVALLLLIAGAPVMILIMAAIKMSDPGPVFYRQKRRGYDEHTFDIIKFRTMRVTAEPAVSAIFQPTVRDDPRIFPVGSVLRKSSLDELPQLLNVLKGDMWIVGPRPHPLRAHAGGVVFTEAVTDYAARYRIKPGVTGWAQVRGWRGPTDTLEQLSNRLEHDLYYIEHWSPLFDGKILLRTTTCLFGQKNAF